LGGRGAGKTRAGAEWIAEDVAAGGMRRVGLIGATMRDARAVMVEGESGLLGVVDGAVFEPSNNRVLWPSGAVATLLSAEEPDTFRGHQFDGVWGDEFCKWREPQAALDMALMAMRLGEAPRMLLTTTPRNMAALKQLLDAPDVVITRGKTSDNNELPADFYLAMKARYGATALGRQELDGELIADQDGALWRRDWIEAARVREVPELERVVVAVDPPVSSTGDECGIVVAGRRSVRESDQGKGADGYVLADYSLGGLTPAGWAARVMQAYADFDADTIIAEANQGGDMVKSVLQQADANAPVKLVHASRGKITRAAPMAALYEAGRIHHADLFAALEDQMCARARRVPTAWMRWCGRCRICLKAGGAIRAFANFRITDVRIFSQGAAREKERRAADRAVVAGARPLGCARCGVAGAAGGDAQCRGLCLRAQDRRRGGVNPLASV
jgi:phage terminase large subunit-like protein